MKLPWSVTSIARNIHHVELVAKSVTDHWWFLLSGDRHHDNPLANHDLEKQHLDEVVKRKGGWLPPNEADTKMAVSAVGPTDKRCDALNSTATNAGSSEA